MSSIRRILFAVRDPAAARQPGLTKAIRIAKSFGASLEMFHALASPVFLSLQPMTGESIEALRARGMARVRERLQKFSVVAGRRGVTAGVSVAWDYPPHEAIVRRATQVGADLIIAECHHGTRRAAWLMQLTDWELLRCSALPVLLLRNPRPYRRPVVLAAVDPSHAHAKPARLDADILSAARQFSVALHGLVRVVFANDPPLATLALPDPALNASALSLSYESMLEDGRKAFDRLMDAMAIEPTRRHVETRPAVVTIPAVARATKASLVVMGAVSRSALKRLFIGNTAERVLDALPCDVLVVHPRGAQSGVLAVPRGMRLVSQPPTPLVA
jgi:universal stress protein E